MSDQYPHQCSDPSRCRYCKSRVSRKTRNESGKCGNISCDLPLDSRSKSRCTSHHNKYLSQYKDHRREKEQESQALRICWKCSAPLSPGNRTLCDSHMEKQRVAANKYSGKKRAERKAAAKTNDRLGQPGSDAQETGQDTGFGTGFSGDMGMTLASSLAQDSTSYYAPSTEPWMLPENPAPGLESTSNPYLSNAYASSSSYGEPYDQVTQGFFADAMYMHDVYGNTLDGGAVQQSSDYSTQADFQAGGIDNIPFDPDNSNLPGWYTQPYNPPGY
ncbi:hypothetical protein F4774DRAFT_383539 [Daldinia eschscholtzii]|nr:hypothetical protein F4774DRAFT_383539 [Daldinia eschscholtzii]